MKEVIEEKKSSPSTIEEGTSELIKSDDNEVYSLIKNTDKSKNKIFISINYPDKTLETEFASLYTDLECKNLFQELKPSKGFNNFYNFDIPEQDLFLKSNHPNGFIFYYKYCIEKDIEQINIIKKKLRVKCLDNKDNNLKIAYDCPYNKEVTFNTKYTIYVGKAKGKKYKIFNDAKIEGTKIVEGNKDKYETNVKIDSNIKGQFVYIVAESKDPNVNLRPKIVYKGVEVMEASNKWDNIINGILIVLIIITFIYKVMKKRRKMQANNDEKLK